MEKTIFFLLLVGCSLPLFETKPNRDFPIFRGGLPPVPSYRTEFLQQRLDHFNFEENRTYRQRYLVADEFWGNPTEFNVPTGKCRGPIFFYTGNESPVTDYYSASGFFTQVLAPKYGALLIFAEHRYFGESMPFGNSSFDQDKVGFCSTDQALADYAVLIQYLKENLNGAQDCPVIAFGGSYGGMLTTWFRIKYPNIVIGGLAASAPFNFVGSGISPDAFALAASNTFEAARAGCGVSIQKALLTMEQMASTISGRSRLTRSFELCKPLKTVEEAYDVLNWVINGLTGMAMLDYPYPTNYGISLPGWPVNKTCDRILDSKSDIIDSLAFAIGVFYNNTGSWSCYDINKDQPDWGACCGWNYLACTVVYLPYASAGIFPPAPWNVTNDIEACKEQFGVTLDPEWPEIHWGGFSSIKASSNIIFSNGLLDPWHTSGVLTNLSDSLTAIVIPDLRAPNDADPIYVIDARKQEDEIIGSWLKEYFAKSQ